jgi:hypothetical protein
MNNTYVEHLVKGKESILWKLLFGLAVILAAGSLWFAMVNVFGILLFIACSVAVYFVWLNSSIEYEYLYIDGEFSVDTVLHKSRRRKLVNVKASDLIICAPVNSEDAKYNANGAKLLDVSGQCPDSRKYVYVYNQGSQKYAMTFEMTDALEKEIRYYTPQKYKQFG